ncbi:hypothetical protein [Spongiimicrobium sp. 2-473A-2-J]|uniref:hypothetical protein n=1 Tax=Eudoraea algarum TaxID=3417568 RepID=UPI003D369747
MGVKRVLNYDPDENVRSRPIYDDPERGDEYFGVFNLQYTGKTTDVANGVLRKVERSDFDAFIAREVGYSLVKISCSPFEGNKADHIEAYALCAPEFYNGRRLVNNDLLPNVPYYKVCKEGASHISEAFLNVWLDTSFLGDGRNVRIWEIEEGIV